MSSQPIRNDNPDNPEHWLEHREVIEARARGESVDSISRRLNRPKQTIYSWIKKAVDAVRDKNQEMVEEMFLVHHHRLELLWDKVWAAVENGDYRAADVAIRILDRQSRLLGLDKSRDAVGRAAGANDSWTQGVGELVKRFEALGFTVPDHLKDAKVSF